MSNGLLRNHSRRDLFKGAASLGLVSLFQAWQTRKACADGLDVIPGPYGPVAPAPDQSTGLPLLQLPKGFHYRSFAWTGDPMMDGHPVPGSHDGMAVVAERVIPGIGAATVLIRNHERGLTPSLIAAPARYDTAFINAGSASGYPGGGATYLISAAGSGWRWARRWAGRSSTARGGRRPGGAG